jgi:D-arabinose 1-dehydrogenase-like Zn-dependent alcohol dehydrogenase
MNALVYEGHEAVGTVQQVGDSAKTINRAIRLGSPSRER